MITTPQLTLRTITQGDLPAVLPLVQHQAVAATTLRIPHPCSPADLQKWFEHHQADTKAGRVTRWVMVDKSDALVGMIKLTLRPEFESAELGYWVGQPYWGRGYATEAAQGVIQYGFEKLKLNRIEAYAMVQNGASFRIFDKLGMKEEGHHRQIIKKNGVFTDAKSYSILRAEWAATSLQPASDS